MNKFVFQPVSQVSDAVNDQPVKRFWHILVVDDDQAVHDVTHLILADLEVLGRKIQLHSAYSAAQAKSLLESEIPFAMTFVDVVMESDDAGLQLVTWIREVLKNISIRIILRTGQAGLAPEEQVISQYDINDYKAKTEFTATKMITSVYAGIRGYRDIKTILKSQNAFQRLITSSTNVLKVTHLADFATAALNNLLTLMKLDSSAVYIVRQETDFNDDCQETYLACTGRFGETPQSLDSIPANVNDKIQQAFANKENKFNQEHFIGFYQASAEASSVLYIEFDYAPTHFKRSLMEMYATNIALTLESLVQQQQTHKSQRELLYIVGDAIEARSKETGLHVKRVSLMCELLAISLGLSHSFVQALKVAAPLHDIGKVAIPDNILHKQGTLNPAEWELMKSHAAVGGTLLDKSNLPVARLGSRLARYHHENWDGSGYPEGLSNTNIPIEARIMAIIDVIDALGSNRSYKDAWSNEQILAYIEEQRGKKFDPLLVDKTIENFDLLMQIRQDYPD